MKKCAVGLLSQDNEYTERLLSFIRLSQYRSLVQIVWYTDAAYCQSMLTEENEPDVLLLDISNQEDGWQQLQLQAGCPVVWLEDDAAPIDPKVTVLEKFQPLNRLMDAVLQLAGRSSEKEGRNKPGGQPCMVLGVYSASGGAGKTIFAYTAAGLLARMGYHPVVLTLESIPSPCWSASGEDRFGRAMFRVSGSKETEEPGLGPELVEDTYRKVRFLPGAHNRDDVEEMDAEDAQSLIYRASQTLGTDAVIVDLDCSLHPRMLGALEACDRIAYLIPDHSLAREKAQKHLTRLIQAVPGVKEKLSVLLNGSTGTPREWNGGGMETEDILPYQEEWRLLGDFHQLDAPTPYQNRLQKWLTSALKSPSGTAGARRNE